MIIDENDEVWADELTLDRAERLLTKWADDGDFWIAPQNAELPKSAHYLPGDEW